MSESKMTFDDISSFLMGSSIGAELFSSSDLFSDFSISTTGLSSANDNSSLDFSIPPLKSFDSPKSDTIKVDAKDKLDEKNKLDMKDKLDTPPVAPPRKKSEKSTERAKTSVITKAKIKNDSLPRPSRNDDNSESITLKERNLLKESLSAVKSSQSTPNESLSRGRSKETKEPTGSISRKERNLLQESLATKFSTPSSSEDFSLSRFPEPKEKYRARSPELQDASSPANFTKTIGSISRVRSEPAQTVKNSDLASPAVDSMNSPEVSRTSSYNTAQYSTAKKVSISRSPRLLEDVLTLPNSTEPSWNSVPESPYPLSPSSLKSSKSQTQNQFEIQSDVEEYDSFPIRSLSPSSGKSSHARRESNSRLSSQQIWSWQSGSLSRPGSGLQKEQQKREPIPVKDISRAMDFEKLLNTQDTVKLTSTPERLKDIEVKKNMIKLEAKAPVTERMLEDSILDSDSDTDTPKNRKQETFLEFLKNSGPEDISRPPNKPQKNYKSIKNTSQTPKGSIEIGKSKKPIKKNFEDTKSLVSDVSSRRETDDLDDEFWSSGDEEFGPRRSKSPTTRDHSLIEFLRTEPPTKSDKKKRSAASSAMKLFGMKRSDSGPELSPNQSTATPMFQPPVNGGKAQLQRNTPQDFGPFGRNGRSPSQNSRHSEGDDYPPRFRENQNLPPVPPIPDRVNLKIEKRSLSEPAPIDRIMSPPPPVPELTPELVSKINKSKEQHTLKHRNEQPVKQFTEQNLIAETTKHASGYSSALPEQKTETMHESSSRMSRTQPQKLAVGTNDVLLQKLQQVSPNFTATSPSNVNILETRSFAILSDTSENRSTSISYNSESIHEQHKNNSPSVNLTRQLSIISGSSQYQQFSENGESIVTLDRVARGLSDMDRDFARLFDEYSTEESAVTRNDIASLSRPTNNLRNFVTHRSSMSTLRAFRNSAVDMESVNMSNMVKIPLCDVSTQCAIVESIDFAIQTMEFEKNVSDEDIQTAQWWEDADLVDRVGHIEVQTEPVAKFPLTTDKAFNYEIQKDFGVQCQFISGGIVRSRETAVQTLHEVLVVEDIPLDDDELIDGDYANSRRSSLLLKHLMNQSLEIENYATEISTTATVFGSYSGIVAEKVSTCEACLQRQKYEAENFVEDAVENSVGIGRPGSSSKSEASEVTDETATDEQNFESPNTNIQFFIPLVDTSVQTNPQEHVKSVQTQSELIKIPNNTVDTQTESHLMTSYVRSQTEASNVYMMLIQENTRLHEENTSLKLSYANERSRSEALEVDRQLAENKFEQLARLAHSKLQEAYEERRKFELEVQVLTNFIQQNSRN